MTYWNPVMQYGVDRFADDLLAAGGAGLITPDLIADEAAEWIAASERTGLDRVFLAAPTSTDARLERPSSRAAASSTPSRRWASRAPRATWMPRPAASSPDCATPASTSACVGIGISTADQVREVLGYADGAIVGSALVTRTRRRRVSPPSPSTAARCSSAGTRRRLVVDVKKR